MVKILMSNQSSRALRAAVAACTVAGLGGQVLAQSNWTGSVSQDYNDAGNWSAGVPTGVNAIINTATGNFPILGVGGANQAAAPNDIFIGTGAGNSGRLDHTAGTAATGNGAWFFVGANNGNGTYNLANTAVVGTGISGYGQGTGSLTVGRFWVAGADFNDNGTGVVNINTTGTLTATNGDGSVVVGEAYTPAGSPNPGTANGTVNFESGTILSNEQTFIGRAGNGTWNQSGGTMTSRGYVAVGREFGGKFGDENFPGSGTPAGNGVINLSGGTFNSATAYGFTSLGGGTDSTAALNVSGTGIYDASSVTPEATANGGIVVGEGWQGPTTAIAQATLTVSGSGEVRLGANRLQIGLTANGNGTVNLNGGTLSTAGIFKGAGGATVNFNGGTLKPTAASTDFVTGVGNLTVLGGGARIDTAGFDTTINTPFIAGSGSTGGITKAGSGTLTLTGVSNYTGRAVVQGGALKLTYSSTLANAATPVLTGGGADVQGGSLVIDYTSSPSPVSTVRTLLRNSFAAPTTPGILDSGQIISSTSTAIKGLGYRDDGAGNVTIKVALYGDADLDGGVSINDFNTLAGNFGAGSGKFWVDGDFDYDGGVSINDFNLLAGGFGQSLPPSSEAWAGLLAFAAAHNDLAAFEAVTGVPEPTSLGLIAAGATLGLRRRRR